MVSDYISYLPHLNACLNGTSAVLLFSGYTFIRARNVAAHRACQVSALVVSILFLVSYLTYHYYHGTTRFQGTGLARPIYFTILISHTILAIVIVPLVILTFHRAHHAAALAVRVDHGSDRLSYALPDLSFLKSIECLLRVPFSCWPCCLWQRLFSPGTFHGSAVDCRMQTSRSISRTKRIRATSSMRCFRFNSEWNAAIRPRKAGIRSSWP